MDLLAGPTENSNGTNGYGSKLTPGKYDNVDYVWGIRTDTGTTQVSIEGRPIYSWLDTKDNQNTIKANNPYYTSMFNTGSNYTIDGRARADVLLDFLNGPDRDGTGFVRDFLAANEDNRISAVSFGNTARTILEWTEWEEGDEVPIIYLSPDGLTNYVAGLTVADELLHDGAIADSENQKLVIFLGDGVVTAAYGDGRLHNYGGTDPNDAGSLIRTENASSAADAIASLVDAMWD